LDALRILSDGPPLVVAVDDAQWLDRPSAGVLEFCFRRLERERVSILLTSRNDRTVFPLALDRSLPPDRLRCIRLGPLSLGVISEILRSRLGAVLPRYTITELYEARGGNPFFIRAGTDPARRPEDRTASPSSASHSRITRPGAHHLRTPEHVFAGGQDPPGTIVRKERPHPRAQLRFTDIGGHRFTCFATSTRGGQLADLELRHRLRAHCVDRIRNAKDTGLRNLPPDGYAQNQIWCEIVALACELLAWVQMLALTGASRRWEPKRLRLRIFACAGRIVRGGQRLRLRQAARWPWASHITAAITRLHALAARLTRQAICADERSGKGWWTPPHPARQSGRQATQVLKRDSSPKPQANEDTKDRG